ncbi:hypothetical protein GCE86_28730 [Micromonospora terminaliae]|uniref:DUF11 domain-containing protein n=1 Tax=Micromonospora terminaliae TaxID=1914461 RepID=A0AAJ2ZBT7_9ACTN|nr:hypothetical protein [Micromonospora terminaliae]NES26486.1 hypothetical protein [Micromonospora terminaliae]QGL50660.1 hypothetical protein GCE86_28730 [Micromonospora terminaliae]
MARPRVRPARRAALHGTPGLLVPALVAGVAAALAVAPAWAVASPTVTAVALAAEPGDPGDPGDPGGDPGTDPTEATPTVDPTTTEPAPTSPPPTEEIPPTTPPPATTTPPAPTTTAPEPVPTTTAPTTTAPAPPPVGPPPVVAPPPPGQPAASPLGVRVTTDDVVLTPAYWNAASTVTTLRVTVTNTGGRPEQIRLAYTLPPGLTDAGTPGCASAGGGSHRCGEWTTAPGAQFRASIRVRVAGTAWRSMPLSGSVRVTATAPGVAATGDDEGFAVLFPPGPPVPGISLRADEVLFDISGAPTTLGVRLGNTGKVDAAGRVDVVLPAGVTVTDPPAGCAAAAPNRTRCELGTVPAGRTVDLSLPVTASAEAQRRAPLAGAVVARLDPRSGRDRQVQMSFRITAAAALATPAAVGAPAPTGSQGVVAAAAAAEDDDTSVHRTAVTLIGVSGVLVVLALALATTSLRRRAGGSATDPVARPAEE